MIGMLKRHEIEILLKAGHSQPEVARLSGVGLRSVRRIAKEPSVVDVDDAAEREKRRIGRPNLVQNFREQVEAILKQEANLPSLEILRRVREAGYPGGKTALYELVASLRPQVTQPLVRFEGLPGEFSQHDFGQVKGAVPQWLPAARSFLCLAVEVLAPYPRQFGSERDGGTSGAHFGGAPAGLGRASPVVRVRPAEDHRSEVGEKRGSDGMESGLRRSHAGDGHRRGVVLALSSASERERGEFSWICEVFLLQGAEVL